MDHSKNERLSDGINAPWWKFWRRRRTMVAMIAGLGVGFMLLNQMSLTVTFRTISREEGYDYGMQKYQVNSFLSGYLLTQVGGGILAPKLGAVKMIAASIAASSILTLLTPLAVYSGVGWLISIRVVQGMIQGVVFPCLHELWTHWAPRRERTYLVLTALDGIQMGMSNSVFFGEILINSVSWEFVFYIFGTLGCLWSVYWTIMVQDNPEKDLRMSPSEKEYILQSVGDVGGPPTHPWKSILTSKAVFACVFANFCQVWGTNSILHRLPTFLKDNFNFKVAPSAFIATLPYLATSITLQIAAPLADCLQNRRILTTTQVRRNFTCAAFVAQVVFMLSGALVMHAVQTSIFMALAMAMRAVGWAGYIVNLLDLSPKSAGVLMGLVGSVGTIADLASPMATKLLTLNKTTEEWNVLFLITAGMYLVGCLVYWFMASGELQPWAKEPSTPPTVVRSSVNSE